MKKQGIKSQPSREIAPWIGWWMKAFFVIAHLAVPLAVFYLVQISICHGVELSWQLLALCGVGLLPFLLPLISAYFGKVGPLTTQPRSPWWATIPGSPDKAILDTSVEPQQHTTEATTPPPKAAQAEHRHLGPNFDALTDDEKSVLKTLWTYQLQHTAGKGEGWWGFQVPEASPEYSSYLRGAGSLSERKLISLAGGMAFLNDDGLRYCANNIDKLKTVTNYWKVFKPAQG